MTKPIRTFQDGWCNRQFLTTRDDHIDDSYVSVAVLGGRPGWGIAGLNVQNGQGRQVTLKWDIDLTTKENMDSTIEDACDSLDILGSAIIKLKRVMKDISMTQPTGDPALEPTPAQLKQITDLPAE